ncbi:DUF4935 domain-containing protein [Nostoc muscorum FACHB-395]|nr:DUF4935 domain-containing protein [Desmonostoc muscorum FACHB-395]
MRNLFPGYYQPTENEFQEIWQECIFTFDTNVLLNIYRYTPKTRERLFDILSKFKDRIWLPYQAAYEYQKERHSVISQQSKAYDEIKKILSDNLTKLQGSLNKFNKHTFIDIDEIKAVFEEALNKSASILNTANSQHKSVNFDELRDKLDEIFSENIGNNYAKDELEAIYKEAQQRFNNKIPPGYMDDKDKGNPEKYGDFIIWHQLINYASLQKKPLIFVTDDGKEDWWSIHEGKKNSPRPELVEEMQSTAGVIFYMYSSDRFMDYAEKFLNLPHQQEIIEEARDIRLQNEEEQLVQEQKKQLEKIETIELAKELAQQTAALQTIKINPAAMVEAALQATRINPAMVEAALQATRINSAMVEEILQATRINPAMVEGARLNLSNMSNIYADALRYASAIKSSTSFNSPQEDIGPTSNQESI